MKTFSTIYLIISLFLALCTAESDLSIVVDMFTNLAISVILVYKFNRKIFHSHEIDDNDNYK